MVDGKIKENGRVSPSHFEKKRSEDESTAGASFSL